MIRSAGVMCFGSDLLLLDLVRFPVFFDFLIFLTVERPCLSELPSRPLFAKIIAQASFAEVPSLSPISSYSSSYS